MSRVRAIAYYLPQFHPIPENDQWWGKGFTEWTNVAKACPLFKGHYQPHLPADLGFYDLRLPEVREAQAQLAREAGIEGFCYWHYWFHGRRLLERPFEEVLKTGRPNFPFCLGWANESWSRRWSGEDEEILIEQRYSDEDDLAHARWLAAAFADPRYLTVGRRPLFVLYRPDRLPNAQRTIETLRRECLRLGLKEPYVVGRDTHCCGQDTRRYGCDITEYAAPNLPALRGAFRGLSVDTLLRNSCQGILSAKLKVYPYEKAIAAMARRRPSHPHLPGFFVGWDNTARRGRDAIAITQATPAAVGRALKDLVATVAAKPPEHRIIFLNAWNEWAEGMHLEPDQKHGHGLLRAVREALNSSPVADTKANESGIK